MNTCREKLEPISREDENSNKTVCHRHEHQVAIGSLSEWLGLTLGSIGTFQLVYILSLSFSYMHSSLKKKFNLHLGVLTLALLYIRKK